MGQSYNRISNTGFLYDAVGNFTEALDKNGNTVKYVYDTANRLIQLKNGSNSITGEYRYGSSNQRLKATEGGVTTYYAADGSGVVTEFQAVGAGWQWQKNFVKWGDRLVATETANGLQYQHPDRLGTKLITNASGGVLNVWLPLLTPCKGAWYPKSSIF